MKVPKGGVASGSGFGAINAIRNMKPVVISDRSMLVTGDLTPKVLDNKIGVTNILNPAMGEVQAVVKFRKVSLIKPVEKPKLDMRGFVLILG